MMRGGGIADTSIGDVHPEVIPDNQVVQGQPTMCGTHGVKGRKSIEEGDNPASQRLCIRASTNTHPVLAEILPLKHIPDRIDVVIHEHPTAKWHNRLLDGIQ
jgi:hypothetical protein